MKKVLLVLAAVAMSYTSFGQFAVTTNGGSGLAGSYASLADAITALNAATISSPVVITCPAGTETNPAGGYSITATGSALNTITIEGAGAANSIITAPNPAGAAGALNDAIFKIIGGDFITIQGFTMNENPLNTTTTAASNNMVEWGVALLYATTTNGAQNCTIQNNIITLNRTYQNTFGIYSNSTHSATTISTSATATTTAGGNSGLKIYGNTISNVNNGIVVVGPTAAADHNNLVDIGGAGGAQANSITNFGTTGTFSGYANVSGTVNGILVRNSINVNVSYNTITSSVGGVIAGTLNGIQVPASSIAPTVTFTNNINYNIISLRSGLIAGGMNGINYPSGSSSATSTLNVNNNDFNAFGHTVAGTAAITFITVSSTNQFTNINSNTFTNISVNTAGSVTFISQSFTAPATGTKSVNGNSIITGFSKTGAGGTVAFVTDNGSTIAGAISNCQNNNFSNVTLTGATAITGISYTDGGTAPTRTVTGNILNNWTTGAATINAMNFSYWNGVSSLSTNTITNILGQGAITAITIGSSANTATSVTIASNIISNLSSTVTGGAVLGITCSNTSTLININNNTISTLSTTAGSAVTGINIIGATATNVFKNKIYDLSGSNASSTVTGIAMSLGTTVNIYNNLIGDLRTPAANAGNPLIGINLTGGTAANVYYNTIYLNGSSSGALFGSSGISFSSSTPSLNLRNNAIFNSSSYKGAGNTAALRRSSGTTGTIPTNYLITSNNNLLYAGPVSPNNLLYVEGVSTFTNPMQTIAALKTFMSTRDQASISENPPFLSTLGSNAGFLHIDPSIATGLESGAATIAANEDDYDGHFRFGNAGYPGGSAGFPSGGTAPDIGADEFAGIPLPLCSGTPAVSTINGVASVCSGTGTGLTLSTTYTDLGITFQWKSSALAGGPYDIILGTSSTQATGNLSATTYYICEITCNGTETFTTTEKEVLVKPIPTASASSSAPVCAGGTLTLTGTTIIGTSFSWIGPNGFTSTDQNPVIINITTAASGTYTFIATTDGCSSLPGTVAVTVNAVPTGVTASASSNAVCDGVPFDLFANYNSNPALISPSGDGGFETGSTFALNNWTVLNGAANNWFVGTAAGIQGGTNAAFAGTAFVGTGVSSVNHFYRDIAIPAGATNINLSFYLKMPLIDNNYDYLYVYTTTTANTPLVGTIPTTGYTQVLAYTTPALPNYTLQSFTLPNALAGTTVRLVFTFKCDGVTPFGVPAVDNISLTAQLPALTYAWASNPTGFTSIDQNPVGVIQSATTEYIVTAQNSAGCTSIASTIVTNVTGAAITTQPLAAAKCSGQTATFTVVASGPSLTYQWRKGGVDIPFIDNASAGTATLSLTNVSVSDAADYDVVVQATCGSPVTSDAVALAVSQTPTASATASPACLGQTLNLTGSSDIGTIFSWTGPNGFTSADQNPVISNLTSAATGNYTFTATAGSCSATSVVSITASPIPTAVTVTPSSASVCEGTVQQLVATGGTVSGNGTIGTGNVSNTTNTPYKGFWGGSKSQYLFTATELTAMGLTSGTPITALTFSISAFSGPYTFLNFNIGMKNTASTVLTAIETGVTTVLSPSTFTLTGTAPFTQMHTLTSSFNWDGSSNLLIEVCFVNADGGGASANSANVVSTTTGTNLAWYYSNDTQTTVCSAPGLGSSSTLRPNIRFDFGTPTSVTWSPFTYLYTDVDATIAYSGTATPVVYTKPYAGITYTATATSAAGCSNTGTSVISLASSPTITLQPLPVVKCAGETATFTVAASIPGVTYQWRKGGIDILVGDNASAITATLTLTNVSAANAANYDVVVSAACGTPQTSDAVSLTVNPVPTASASSNSPLCTGATLNLAGTTDIGTSYSWTGPNGFTSSVQNPTISSITASAAGNYLFTATAEGCTSVAGSVSVIVNITPSAVSVTPATASLCEGTIQQLTATGGAVNATILSEDFNGSVPGWTTINASTGGTPANAAWMLYVSGTNFYSNDNTNFVMSNSDAQGSGTTATQLITPSFSTMGFTSLNLSFWHFYREYSGSSAEVEVSTDGGATWVATALAAYTTTQGGATAFVNVNIDLSSYLNQANLKLRFRYDASWGYYWAIDNVILTGNQATAITWSPASGLYIDALAQTAYNGENLLTVYAKPLVSAIYTATAASGAGCTNSGQSSITVNPLPTVTAGSYGPVCEDGADISLGGSPAGGVWTGTGVSGSYVFDPSVGTQTLTYTYTDANFCTNSATTLITVNTLVTPTFDPIAAICAGISLSPLPLVSLNGITGSWSPALNNMATTIYTFTPDAGQCANETTLTIAVNDLPVVTDVTLRADVGTAPSTWSVPVGGTFSTGFDICIDPAIANTEYYFLDISTLISSVPLKIGTLNGFNINVANIPANWFTYWSAKGVTAGATLGTWQAVMWPIINGNAPILYINYDGSDYQLIDGLIYQFTTNMIPLRISGDYPEWNYSFNGRVESVVGCLSSFFDVFLEINSLTTPTFNPVAAICAGGSLSALPTTSINGITGSWSPVLNNMVTTTYTFTPDAGQCATETTLIITVNQLPIVDAGTYGPVCIDGADITLIGSPTGGVWTGTGVSGSGPYVFDPSAGTQTLNYTFTDGNFCSNSALTEIIVNALVTPTFNPVAAICAGGSLSALPTTSINGITGSWVPGLNNMATTTYTFTPDAGQCATETTLIITVNQLPVVDAGAYGPVCIDGADITLVGSPTGGVWTGTGVSGSGPYVFDPSAGTQTLNYTFTDGNFCSNSALTEIIVNALVTPTFNPVAAICAGGSLSALPTTSINGITGSWSPVLNNMVTTTYTFTPTAGQCAIEATLIITVNPLPIVSAGNNGPLSLGATLNLTGTANIGTLFSWTGPDGFSSILQNPSIPSVTLAAAGTYTFTATADGCSATASTDVVVTGTPVDLTITADQTVCNNTAATLAVTSELSGFDSYIWSPLANLYSDPDCLVEYTGTSATTVYVKTSVAGTYTFTCNATNSVTLFSDDATTAVTVIPASVTITAPPSGFCQSGSVTISASPLTGYGAATLQWQNSPDNSVFTDISGANGLTYTTPTLTSTTYYKLLVKIGTTVCLESNVAAVAVNNPQVTETTPGARCGAGTVELAAVVSSGTPTWYSTVTGGLPLGTGSPFTTPSINATTNYYVGAEIVSTSTGDATIGAGTLLTSSSGYPTAFGNYWYQDWQQLVYTASELNAIGLNAGNITGIKFNCSAPAGPAIVAGYTISIANTAASVLTGFTTTGLSVVYGPAAYTSTAGINTITFSTPYYWNGTSNLIIDIRGSGAYGSANATTRYTATTGNTVVSARSSSNNTNFWTSNPTVTTSKNRLNITFSGVIASVCSSPRVAVEATINTPPAITATATPATICAGESSELYVSSTNMGYSYVWTPGNLAGDTQPISPATTTTYTVTATDNSGGPSQGCVASASVGVTVNPIPTITASASTSGVCAGAPFNLYSDANSNSAPANSILLDPTGDGGFETGNNFADNNWTVVNSASNFWVPDNLAPAYAGLLGAHISIDGSAYDYSNTITATSHLYRDIPIPAGSTNISLKFYWKGNGESGWDRMLVYTAPTSVTPVVNVPVSSSTTLSGATLVWTQTTFPQASYTQVTVALPNSLAGTTVRLIFTWQGDDSFGSNPPAAIDNIMLSADVPAPPAYTWSSVPAGFTSTDQNPVGVTQAETTEYIVTAQNSFGCTASASVTVANVTGAEITTQPESIAKCVGETATFTVVVSGSGLTYQWRKGGTDISVLDNPSAGTAALTLLNVTEADEAGYDVFVTASCGVPVTSDPAALTVNPLPIALISGPLTGLTYQPLNYLASGYSGTPNFQWQFATALAGPYTNFGTNVDNTQAFANAGTTFYIRCIVSDPVTGCSAESNVVTTVVSVAGDNVCGANTIVVGNNGPYTNIGATLQTGEAAPPTGSGVDQLSWGTGPSNTVWFSFVAPASGRVSLNFGTTANWDSQVALWGAPSCGDLLTGGGTLIAANDDITGASPYHAAITPVCVNPGQTYYVQVDGYSSTTNGAFQLVLVEEPSVVTASVSAPAPICSGGNADITFTGTTGATVTYDINGGAPLTTLLTDGTSVVNTGVITSDVTYNLLSVSDGTCTQFFTGVSVTLGVNSLVTPTFNPVPPILEGGSMSPLPTTSLNGITGTWSPELNNTVTTTYTFTPGAGQCATVATLTITIFPAKTLNLGSVLLEGLYAGSGLMRQAYNAIGPEYTAPTADHIKIELHDATNNYTLLRTYDDVLLSTSGVATVPGIDLPDGNYRITIKHRNSIETTSTVVVFTGVTVSYSFGTAASAYDNNLKLIDGFYCIFGGDVNQDGQVEGEDVSAIENGVNDFSTGYLAIDVDGDGSVDISDYSIWDNNNNAFVTRKIPTP